MPTAPVATSSVVAGDYRMHAVHYLTPGGPDVVAVHGLVVAAHGVAPLARALRDAGLSVHVPDLPGFGRSDKPRRALDVDGLASALSTWVRASRLDPDMVLGNSFGTQVAAAAVAGHPRLARSLVLLSPTIDPRLGPGWLRRLPHGRPGGPPGGGPAARTRAAFARALIPVRYRSNPSLRSLIIREYLASGVARAVSTVRHALSDDLVARLPTLDMPVLVLRGERDENVSPEWAHAVAGACPRGRLEVVPGADHDAQYNAPQSIAETVARFRSAVAGVGQAAPGE